MNRSKKVLKIIDLPADKQIGEDIAGPREEDIVNYVFSALIGEKSLMGVQINVGKATMRKAPLEIKMKYPFQGRTYDIRAEIPAQALRVLSIN